MRVAKYQHAACAQTLLGGQLYLIRVKENGEKRPEGSWERYQTTRASRAEVTEWYSGRAWR